MDILIISTDTLLQKRFWEQRLASQKGCLLKKDAIILIVDEDWPGGAGNGLGSLYAYRKAQEQGKALFGIDIFEKQKSGASIALYHTTGMGKRLCPFTLSEYNNKSAVKLPCLVSSDSTKIATLLEGVIKQTSTDAQNRKSRFSVYWGDQIFIPKSPFPYNPKYHIDILVKNCPAPSQQKWTEMGLENYGLVVCNALGQYELIDKSDFASFQNLILSNKILVHDGINLSFGSFSLSTDLTMALLTEFEIEIKEKNKKMDSDPFFWMPLTLDYETYEKFMQKKGYQKEEIIKHYHRMQKFKEKTLMQFPENELFGIVNLGNDCYWWDYGTIDAYYSNNMKLTRNDAESQAMRSFFNINGEGTLPTSSKLKIDANSFLLNCEIKSGSIKNSILVGVKAENVNISNSIIINSLAKSISADQAIMYNVNEVEDVILNAEEVRADLFLPNDQHFKIYSKLGRDGKEDWNIKLPSNEFSYEELFKKINHTSQLFVDNLA